MKKTSVLLLTNLIIAAIGVLFIAASQRDDIINTMILFTGILFIVPGIINIVALMRDATLEEKDRRYRGTTRRMMGWLTSIAAIILGATMCFFPEFYAPIMLLIFAGSLVLGGIYHLFMMFRGLRPVVFPGWSFLMPLPLLGGGLWLFFGDFADKLSHPTAILITGIGMIVFAIITFYEMLTVKAWARNHTPNQLTDVSTN